MKMVSWCSLFLPCDNAVSVADVLRDSLGALGYTLFNPFGTMPGLSYPQAVRLFVEPARNGWTRVIGEPDEAQLPRISQTLSCLLVMLTGTLLARIEFYEGGEQQVLETALAPYLKPEITYDKLHLALTSQTSLVSSDASDIALMRDMLPENVKAMRVDTRQAQKMFDRLSTGLTQRSGNTGNESAARELLRGEKPEWNSKGGVRIRATMDCLTIPRDWQTPEFVVLRDAYQLHERKRRNPNASLYPGDAEAMEAVPDALDYTAVYAGRG
jgi:hypothetical protein